MLTTLLDKPNSLKTLQLYTDIIQNNRVLLQRGKSIYATYKTDRTNSVKHYTGDCKLTAGIAVNIKPLK